MKHDIINFIKRNAIWLVLLALVVTFTLVNPRFLSMNNLFIVARQVSMYGIASIGMTFVILIAGIDLSIGSIITVVNVVCAYLMVKCGFGMVTSVCISILLSIVIGLFNSVLIASVGIPSIIATFATQIVVAGAAYLISGGVPIYGFDPSFKVIGQGYVGVVPVPVIIMICCFLIGSFILNKTYFGRYFYAVGGNEEASKLSGIQVKKIKYLIFALSGFFAGLAGVVMLSRTNSAQPTAGLGYEFDVITCVVLGGVSISGGYGKISGVVAGVLIIGILTNGMILMNISDYTQMVVKGLVLIFAVGFDTLQKKRAVL